MNISLLERWYLDHHRLLPFRTNPEPYAIWVSEIMAQQTKMETLVPYFQAFMKQYPTITDLAQTDSDTLHRLVEGIGYYRRFQHMHEAAKVIVEKYHGVFPSNYEEIIALPGIGPYSAGAIMSIAYNQPYAATDGNVIRVLSRYFGIPEDMAKPASRKKIHELNQKLILSATPRIYTQALMELGALVCSPRQPACTACPLSNSCVAYQENLTETIPLISRPNTQKTKDYVTLILSYQDQVALTKKEEGLLKGMYLYPQYEITSIEEIETILSHQGFVIQNVTFLDHYRHVFTHQIWNMHVYQVEVNVSPKETSWSYFLDVSAVPMATAHRKINITKHEKR